MDALTNNKAVSLAEHVSESLYRQNLYLKTGLTNLNTQEGAFRDLCIDISKGGGGLNLPQRRYLQVTLKVRLND